MVEAAVESGSPADGRAWLPQRGGPLPGGGVPLDPDPRRPVDVPEVRGLPGARILVAVGYMVSRQLGDLARWRLALALSALPAALDSSLIGEAISTSAVRVGAAFPRPMRTTPTLSPFDATPTFNEYGIGDKTGTASTISASQIGAEGFVATIGGFSGLTEGSAVIGKNGSPIILATAE